MYTTLCKVDLHAIALSFDKINVFFFVKMQIQSILLSVSVYHGLHASLIVMHVKRTKHMHTRGASVLPR